VSITIANDEWGWVLKMGKIEAINTEAYVLMLEALPTAFFFVDVETTVQVWNHAAARLSGFTSAAVKGKTLEQSGLKPEICGQQLETSSASIVRDYLQANVASSPSGTKEQMFCIHLEGSLGKVDFICTPVYADSGELLGVVGTAPGVESAFCNTQCANLSLSAGISIADGSRSNVLGAAAFYDALNRDWHRYQRYQNIFSILSLEVDYYSHFEAIYGEAAADEMINKVIANIALSLRRSDIIGQVGVSRFIVLLSNSDRKSTLKVANMVLDNLHQETCFDLPFVMSASIGAVSVEDKQSLDKTLERAENALQRSIEMGRNQVTFWG